MKSCKYILILFLFFANFACKKEVAIDKAMTVDAYVFNLPLGLNPLPAENINPTTVQGVALGKKLFYDPLLSLNYDMSCGSCHNPKYYFSDSANQFSTGFNNQKLNRNSPPLFNLQYAKSYFWDGGVLNLETQIIAPITSPLEMNNTLAQVLKRLNANQEYKIMFKQVFKQDTINSQQLLFAIAQFEKTFLSGNTQYDKYVAGGSNNSLSNSQKNGLELFKGKAGCVKCHTLGNNFTDNDFHNTGLESNIVDSGRYRITLNPNDIGKFKTPSIRNVRHTGPFMHDGRFKTIEEVIRHYNSDFNITPYTDTVVSNFQKGRLSEEEIFELIDFIYTLTDNDFPNNPSFKK